MGDGPGRWRWLVKDQDMKGFTQTWYEIANADGHALAIPQGENYFLTEDLAVEAAKVVCAEYRDTVTVKQHTSEIKRIFQMRITVVEV